MVYAETLTTGASQTDWLRHWQKLQLGLKYTEAKKSMDHSLKLCILRASSFILIYRFKAKPCGGPSKFKHIEESMVILHMNHGNCMFRIFCSKPLIKQTTNKNVPPASEGGVPIIEQDSLGKQVLKRVPVQHLWKYSIHLNDVEVDEISGLTENGTLAPVNGLGFDNEVRMVYSKFLNVAKSADNGYRYERRLEAPNYDDNDATSISAIAPIVQRARKLWIAR